MKLKFNTRGWSLGQNDVDMAEPHQRDVSRVSYSLEQEWSMFYSCCSDKYNGQLKINGNFGVPELCW
jgi:hypothetical protein